MKKLRKILCKILGHSWIVYSLEGDTIMMKCKNCNKEQYESIWDMN